MEKTKQDLSILKDKISESLPDDNDLKGFLGISKTLLLDSIKECELLLIKLETFNNSFETIILKRDLAELFKKLSKDFETQFNDIKPPLFESILNKITKIRFLIRDTYFTVVNEPIKTEIEINKAKDELILLSTKIEELNKSISELSEIKEKTILEFSNAEKELKSIKDLTSTNIGVIQGEVDALKANTIESIKLSYKEIIDLKNSTVKEAGLTYEEIVKLKNSSEVIANDFVVRQNNSITNEKIISEFLVKIQSHSTTIETIDKNTTKWESEIQTCKNEILANSNEYKELNKQSVTLQTEIEANHKKIVGSKGTDGKLIKGYLQETEDLIDKIDKFLIEQENKFLAQFKHIESLLPGATSAGLAEAFEKQRKSYKWPILIWSSIFIIVTIVMTAFSVYLFYIQFLKGNTTGSETLSQGFISLLKDLPFFIPTIWLAVFASKQQSQYKRLQQEYVFKEINAKSFAGHKKQIEELKKNGVEDADLLLKLVTQLVVITSENPSQTLDNKAHNDSPPIFRLIERFMPSKKKEKVEKDE